MRVPKPSITARLRGYGGLGWLSPRARACEGIVCASAAFLLCSTPTFADPAQASARMAREHHACSIVMGLHRPGELYDACIRSLDKSLFELDQEQMISKGWRTCAKDRLNPGTPDFADCVLDVQLTRASMGR